MKYSSCWVGDRIREKDGFVLNDIDYKYKLHGQWAQWILVEDEGTRFGLEMGIHPDALLGPILPPVAKF